MAKRCYSVLLAGVLSACGGQTGDLVERGGGAPDSGGSGGRPGCVTAKDCAADERCVVDKSGSTCLKREESVCHFDSDCQPPLVCASDGQCRSECVEDRDCMKDQVCVFGMCVQGTLVATDGGCPVLPNGPFYECAPVPASPDTCAPRDPAAASGVGYPLSCRYILPPAPMECMLQSCSCQRVRDAAPTWICPK